MTFDTNAKYYSHDPGDEELTHTDPWEAIEQWIDDNYEPEEHIEACIDRICPLTIYGFRPRKIDKRLAEKIIEKMFYFAEDEDYWIDEYANRVDGDEGPFGAFTKEQRKELEDKLVDTVHEALTKHAHVWSCEDAGRQVFDAHEVRERMMKDNPNWW